MTAVAALAPVLAAGQATTGEAKVKGATRTKAAAKATGLRHVPRGGRRTCREYGISRRLRPWSDPVISPGKRFLRRRKRLSSNEKHFNSAIRIVETVARKPTSDAPTINSGGTMEPRSSGASELLWSWIRRTAGFRPFRRRDRKGLMPVQPSGNALLPVRRIGTCGSVVSWEATPDRRCFQVAYNNNVQLFQTPGHVVILNEMINDARVVPLDGRPHLPPSIRQWRGDSRGRWEGNTLVVDTTNFTRRAELQRSQRGSASGRAFHSSRSRHATLRIHGSRSEDVDQTLVSSRSHDQERGSHL